MRTDELVNKIRFKAADEETVQYTDENIMQVINEAHRFIMGIYIDEYPDILTTEQSGILHRGENTIALGSTPIRIVGVRCNGKLLHHAFEKSIVDQSSVGVPECYTMRKECLKIYPIPQEDHRYTVAMIGETKELNYDDELPYPQDFIDFLIEFAVIRLQTVDGASVNTEAGIFSELRSLVLNSIKKLAPDPCVVDSYY